MSRTPQLTTFYSFKGGVGRTQAVANVGALLASKGFRVLLVDFDLEAPGLTWLIDPQTPGVVDLLLDARDQATTAPLFNLEPADVLAEYSAKVSLPEGLASTEGSLRVMPAGRNDAAYGARLNKLDLGGLYLQGTGKPLIAYFKQKLQDTGELDFIFVDSRTGFSDESGICTRDLADALVVLVGLNRQNREGTAAFLSNLRKSGTKPLSVVMSPVPNGEDEAVAMAEQEVEERLTAAWGEGVRVPVDTRIPYHPGLALSEELRFGGTRTALDDAYADVLESVAGMLDMGSSNLLYQTRSALKKKDLSTAVAWLDDLGRLYPQQVESLALTPEMRLVLARDDHAVVSEVLFRRLPRSSWAFGDVAVELSQLRDANARRWFERALTVLGEDALLLTNYAIFLEVVIGDVPSAERVYLRALRADPHSVPALTSYATSLATQDDPSAEEYFEEALRHDGTDGRALGNYATFRCDVLHDYPSARMLYERAVAVEDPDGSALANYAVFLMEMDGDHDAAGLLLRRAVEVDPDDSAVRRMYANFLADHADEERANAEFETSLRLDPSSTDTLEAFAQFHLRRGRMDKAARLIQRARSSVSCPTELGLELCFFEFAFDLRDGADTELLTLLRRDVRSPTWDLSDTVEAAVAHGATDPELIRCAAAVVGDDAPLEQLEALLANR